MCDLLSDQLLLNQLDTIHAIQTKATILKDAKPRALHIMAINIAYAASHTPYKAFRRLQNDIRPYLWHKPFNKIANTLSKYRTADQTIDDLMFDEQEHDSDCTLTDSVERSYDALSNWLAKKHNFYKIYEDLYCTSLNKKDYVPLTQQDTVTLFKTLYATIAQFHFSKRDIKINNQLKSVISDYKDSKNR